MDFIESVFHISPDGGNGLTEIAWALAVLFLVAAAVHQFRRFRRGLPGRR